MIRRQLLLASLLIALVLPGCSGAGPRAPQYQDGVAEAPPPTVPATYAFDSVEAFARHQDNVMACLRWLISTHLEDEVETREAAARYAMQWLSGNHDIRVLVRVEIIGPVMEDTAFAHAEDMPIIYVAAKALHQLEHPAATEQAAEVAGIHGLVRMYELLTRRDPSVRSEILEEYRRLRDQDALARHVAELPPITRMETPEPR